MAKHPRLDEVFISHRQVINVGSAYSLKKAAPAVPSPLKRLWTRKRRFTMNEASGIDQLRPEIRKVVQKFTASIAEACGIMSSKDEIELQLIDFAHEMEKAEGEDPKELDQGGPEPGTTGGK